MDLQTIKRYFGNQMVIFNRLPQIENRLTDKEKEIFYQIGLPGSDSFDGRYIMLPDLKIKKDRYVYFATRSGDEEDFFMYLDLDTHEVIFHFFSEEDVVYNTSLEAFLNYKYIYVKFFTEVRLKEVFGLYEINHMKYAEELKRRLLEYNDDVSKTVWMGLIEEMGYGVV